jgi:hypothetical protein
MSKTATVKKALILLSMGGATFALWGFSGLEAGAPTCVTNADLVGFYQAVGDQGIAAFEDATANAVFGQESDFDNMVIEPVARFGTAMWNNWIADQFPLDVGVSGNWVQ